MLISTVLFLLPSLISVSALPPISAPSPTPFLHSNLTSSVGLTIECFARDATTRPVSIHNCIRALDLIRQEPLWDDVVEWSARRSGTEILRYWTWGPCAIAVFPKSDTAVDAFSVQEVAGMAMNVLTACVAMSDKCGGRVDVGPKGVFSVGVRGKPVDGGYV